MSRLVGAALVLTAVIALAPLARADSDMVISNSDMAISNPDMAACVDYAGNPCPPLACDGALCDTSNGSACSAIGAVEAHSSHRLPWCAALFLLCTLLVTRRRSREVR